MLTAIMLIAPFGKSYATEAPAEPEAEAAVVEYWPAGPSVSADSAIIMEATTGTILYEKNTDKAQYPASITKIMTALIVLERCSLDDIVTFSYDSVHKVGFLKGDSSIARDQGEEMTVEWTLYGMMLESANECAYALAEHVAGDMESFARLMNEKAAELGCINTHFANSHGLHDPDHYTCAYDMAIIARAACENEEFCRIAGTKTYTIPKTNKHPDTETYLQNHHQMLYPLKTRKHLYEYCTGGKTGYTTQANNTLVTFAEKGNLKLICVTLNNSSGAGNYEDTTNLFDYCFDNFAAYSVAENEVNINEGATAGPLSESMEFLGVDEAGLIVLPKTASFEDAVSTISYDVDGEDVIATLNYTYGDRNVGAADLKVQKIDTRTFDFTEVTAVTTSDEKSEKTLGKQKIGLMWSDIIRMAAIILASIIVLILLVVLGRILYRFIIKKWRRRDRGPKYKVIENNLALRQSRRRKKRNRMRRNDTNIFR